MTRFYHHHCADQLRILTGRRIRHVKCDEEKPACNQCRKTGRVCDGYVLIVKEHSAQASLVSAALERSIARIDNGFRGSYQERRSFQIFQCEIGKDLMQAFNTTSTHQLILQTGHTNDAMKHAVVALGSLGEHLMKSKFLVTLPASGDESLDFARLEYSKAVRDLRSCVSEPEPGSLELILTCCLLLIMFDFIAGDDEMARGHLKAGLAILLRCYPQNLQDEVQQEASETEQSQPLIYDLFRIFSVIDLHAAIWLSTSSFHAAPLVSIFSWMAIPSQLTTDLTLDGISTQLNYHIIRSYTFRHYITTDKSALASSIIPYHIYAEKHRLLFELQQWPLMLEQYLAKSDPPNESAARRISLLRMNYHSILIGLSTFLPSNLMECMAHLKLSFAQILAEAEKILRPASLVTREALLLAVGQNAAEENPSYIPPFAFVPGAISPLYVVAVKCKDRNFREKAVSLLEELPWKEGAWNSAVMARIARRHWRDRFAPDYFNSPGIAS